MSTCPYAIFRAKDRPSEHVPLGARSVGRHKVPANWEDKVFRVEHAVFFWSIEGAGLIKIGGEELRLEPDSYGVLLPGQVQSIRSGAQDWEYCWWTMDGPQVEGLISAFGFKAGIYQGGSAPTNLIRLLETVIRRPGQRHELEASAIVYEMTCHAARYISPPGRRQINDPLVNDAVDVILASWQDSSFGIESLADILETHRSSLSRRFKRATGSTMVDYIDSMRMQQAVHLLRYSRLSINEVAHQCGFADPNYFAKKFRARFGEPPSAKRGPACP